MVDYSVLRKTRQNFVAFRLIRCGMQELSGKPLAFPSSLGATHQRGPMLGYPTVYSHCMLRLTVYFHAWTFPELWLHFSLIALFLFLTGPVAALASPQQIRLPSNKTGTAELEAKTQSRQGDVTLADSDVDIRYADIRLRADHVEYNNKTAEAFARGHVRFDYNNEHLEGDEAHYNVSTGH